MQHPSVQFNHFWFASGRIWFSDCHHFSWAFWIGRSYDTSNEYFVYGFGAKIPPSHTVGDPRGSLVSLESLWCSNGPPWVKGPGVVWPAHFLLSCYKSGWWFGTGILWFSICWECHNPNWLICFRGVGIPPTSSNRAHPFGDSLSVSPKTPESKNWGLFKLLCFDRRFPLPQGQGQNVHNSEVGGSNLPMTDPWCWYINANIKGVYWWDPCYHIYSIHGSYGLPLGHIWI